MGFFDVLQELDFTNLSYLVFVGSALLASLFLSVCLLIISTSNQYPIISRSTKEQCFIDPANGKAVAFPSINDQSTLHLSVIIPAYNEEARCSMLHECIEFLENRAKGSSFKYEIIVVSDGSIDGTVEVASKYSEKLGIDKFRILELETNRGKGGAVRLGMMSARGAMLLFADADGATKFKDLVNLESSLKEVLGSDYISDPELTSNTLAISVGSRAHLQNEAVARRSLFRTVLMYGFHAFVWLFAVRGIKDTQCGFKLLTREAGRVCFESLHVERWAFDAELLYIAKHLNIPVTEVSVNWTEIEGSKLIPVWSWLQMGIDLFLIWLRYQIGAWKILADKKD